MAKNPVLLSFLEALTDRGVDFTYEAYPQHVHVSAKNEEEIIAFNGEKRKFRPYIRVGCFGEKEGMLYVRDCGLCEYRPIETVIEDTVRIYNNMIGD